MLISINLRHRSNTIVDYFEFFNTSLDVSDIKILVYIFKVLVLSNEKYT
jgi:hypothetical protein